LKFSLYVRHIGFQNGRHLKSTFAIISGHNAAIDLILVSKCMFLGARNPMVPIATWYCHVFAAILDFKMAALHYMAALRSTFDIISKIMSNVDRKAAM